MVILDRASQLLLALLPDWFAFDHLIAVMLVAALILQATKPAKKARQRRHDRR